MTAKRIPTLAEARLWARSKAVMFPGIQFSFILDGMIYSYLEPVRLSLPHGNEAPLTQLATEGEGIP